MRSRGREESSLNSDSGLGLEVHRAAPCESVVPHRSPTHRYNIVYQAFPQDNPRLQSTSPTRCSHWLDEA